MAYHNIYKSWAWTCLLYTSSVVFILLSIKCIFFDTTSREQIKERQGVLLENESGDVYKRQVVYQD